MRFTLNPKVFTNKVLTSLSKQQNKATLWLVEAAKALTPEDTGLMLNSYRAERVMIEGFVSTSWVSNSATDKGFPYPVVVDRGYEVRYTSIRSQNETNFDMFECELTLFQGR